MIKQKLQEVICLITIFLISTNVVEAAIIQNSKLIHMDDGFLELKSNGSLILRGSLENSSNVWQEAIIFKTILNAMRLMPLQAKNTLNLKIYGDGVEHKFPPFLERVIQRIQTYFSVYKYTDTSKPVRVENKPTTAAATTTTSGIVNQTTLNLDNNKIDVNLTGVTNSINRYNKTTTMSSVNKFTKPIKITSISTTTTTIRPALIVIDDDADEENEFIEIKKNKSFKNMKT